MCGSVAAECLEMEDSSCTMKWFIHIPVAIIVAIAFSPAWSQGTDNSSTREKQKSHESFMDFGLNQLNPRNIDYSCEIDSVRNVAVHEIFGRIDSWAVLVALTLLVLAFFILIHQHQELKRREILAARFLAQYHNALLDLREQLAKAIRQDWKLANVENADDILPPSRIRDRQTQLATTTPDLNEIGPVSLLAAENKNTDKSEAEVAFCRSGKPPVRQSYKPEAELLGQIRILQQQLSAAHEREKGLQRQLSKAQPEVSSQKPSTRNLST